MKLDGLKLDGKSTHFTKMHFLRRQPILRNGSEPKNQELRCSLNTGQNAELFHNFSAPMSNFRSRGNLILGNLNETGHN